jgi:hypothetical protein
MGDRQTTALSRTAKNNPRQRSLRYISLNKRVRLLFDQLAEELKEKIHHVGRESYFVNDNAAVDDTRQEAVQRAGTGPPYGGSSGNPAGAHAFAGVLYRGLVPIRPPIRSLAIRCI